MNRRSILTKTGKGLMEATGKTSNLSRDLRNILKEIDGKVSVNELLEKFDKLTEQKLLELLSGMEKDGYVREFIGKQDEGPRAPAARPSGPPSLGDGSDLDFTAFTPAKPNAKASEEARLQAQAQEIARQAQATRAREEAVAKAAKTRADATAAARAKADADQRAKQSAVTRTGSHTPLPPLINPTVLPPVAPPVAGILGAGAEATARAQADAQARSQAEALERARRDAEEKARRDAEERARAEAEARARAEIEAAIKREAEERALKEIQERTRREEAERARREAEARAKLEAEQRARREAEERQRRELEERTRREVEERLRREEAERRRREEEERARREAERQARIEAETKARVDAEMRAKRETEERVRREDEERRTGEKRKRQEDEERRRQEAEQAAALERALKEEQEKAQREAEEQTERGEQEREEHGRGEREEPILEDEDDEQQRREEEERYAKEEAKRAREEEKASARAAAKARKAERARERAGEEAWRGDEDALRSDAGSLSAAEVWERRRPRSFVRTLGAMLVVLAILGVAALPFVPLDTAPYEKSAQAWLGLPVKIGSLTVTYFPLPQLKFEKVAIGRDPQMRAAVIKASPDYTTLLDDRAKLQSLSMENVTVPKEFLAALLQDRPGSRGLGVQRITAKGLKIDAPELALPGLDFEASLSPDGALRSASLSNGGQLSVRLEPKGGKAAVEISAAALPIPIGVDFGLSDFSAKGIASASDLALSSIEGRAFGGRILGSARLRWGSSWSLDADLSARQMDAAKLAGPLLGAGTLQGKGRVSMRGLLPERMVLNSQVDGNFSVQKGSISNVDMPRLLQGSGSGGGTTLFQELTGDFTADPNRVLVRNIRLAAGLLSGQGQVEMDPQMNLAGRMQIELRAQSVQARSTLGVSGTLANPQFRRTN